MNTLPDARGMAGGGGLMAGSQRVASMTAPSGPIGTSGRARGAPSTKTVGTVTRRTDAPSRRPGASTTDNFVGGGGGVISLGNMTAPPVVMGVGGVRMLRGNKP